MEMHPVAPPLGQPQAADVLGENADQLGGLIAQWVNTLLCVGGVVTIGARRVEYAPGLYETASVVGKWDSYAPAERLAQGDEPEEIKEALEPQPAGG